MSEVVLNRLVVRLQELGVPCSISGDHVVLGGQGHHEGTSLFVARKGNVVFMPALHFGPLGKAISRQKTVGPNHTQELESQCLLIKQALMGVEERIANNAKAWGVWDTFRSTPLPFSIKPCLPNLELATTATPEETTWMAPRLKSLVLRMRALGGPPKIYTASRVAHASKWLALRAAGVCVNSTWIDEAEVGATVDKANLWTRCIDEALASDAVLFYVEPMDPQVGALVEVGAALSAENPVYVVTNGANIGSWSQHPLVTLSYSIREAVESIYERAGLPMPTLPESIT